MLRSYFRYAFIVVFGLLLIALTIDLAQQLTPLLRSRPDLGGLSAAALVAWYSLLRGTDILARNIPLALYLAVFWCECSHTLSNERVAVGVSGRSPLQCIIPAIFLSIIFGCFQIALDIWLRPAAVQVEINEHIGNLGHRFDRRSTKIIRWIKIGDTLISSRIDYGPPPSLSAVTLYRLKPDGQPKEVIIARQAVLSRDPSQWVLLDGYSWQWRQEPAARGGQVDLDETRPSGAQEFNRRVITLDLAPLWLTNYGIDGKYLPQTVLQALASSTSRGFKKSDYQTWVQVRYARGIYVLGMILLAASFGQLLMIRLPQLFGFLGILFLGYAAHAAVKALEILGELGIVAPIVAGWLVPGLLVLGALALQLRAYRTI
jgi:lipopolysaccharide export system permease protein